MSRLLYMGVIMINCELCNEILHEDNFTSCIICEDIEACDDCRPCEIKFKKIQMVLFVKIVYATRLNVRLNQRLLIVQKI